MTTAEARYQSDTNPFESYIVNRIKYRTIRPQFLLSYVAGLAFAFEMIGIYLIIGPTNASNLYGGAALILAFMYSFVPLIIWFVLTLLTFLVTRVVFRARADFGVLFRVSGWAMVPFIGTAASISVGRYITLRQVISDPCTSPHLTCDLTEYVTEAEQATGLTGFAHSAASEPTFQLAYVVGMLFFALTAYLLVVATDEATTLTRAGATLVAGVPIVLVAVVFTMFTF